MNRLEERALEIQRILLLAIGEGTPELKRFLLDRLHFADFTDPDAGKNFAHLHEENRSLFLDATETERDPDPAYFRLIRELLRINRAIDLIPAMTRSAEALRGDPSGHDSALEEVVSTISRHAERLATLQTPTASWKDPSDRLIQLLDDFGKRYLARSSPTARVRWGLRDLDQLTNGLQPGHLYLLVGEKGAGKTSFIMGHARELAKDALVSAVVTADATAHAGAERLLAGEAGVDYAMMATSHMRWEDWPRLMQACEWLAESFPYLFSAAGMSGTELESLLMQIAEQQSPDILFLDDINRLRNVNDLFSSGTQILDLIKRMVNFARERNIPVVASVEKVELPTTESMNSLGRWLSLLDYANAAFAAVLKPSDEILEAGGESMIHHLHIVRNIAGPKARLRIAYNHGARKFEDPPG